jgi:hypothetical protein
MDLYNYQKASVIMVYTLHKLLHYLLGNIFVFYIDRKALVYLICKL